jgi:hypothetical protein
MALVGRAEPRAVPWRLHDIRRTGVATIARLAVDSVVADKLLGHQAAKLRGVAAVQRHDFANERARALEIWSAHVIGICGSLASLEKSAAERNKMRTPAFCKST